MTVFSDARVEGDDRRKAESRRTAMASCWMEQRRREFEPRRMGRSAPASSFEQGPFAMVPTRPKISVARYIHIEPSGGSLNNSDTGAAYVLWPRPQVIGSLQARSSYFSDLERSLPMQPRTGDKPTGPQAKNFADLLTIRAMHNSYILRHGFGTAVGYRIRNAVLTDIPAIIVFVSKKVHPQWLMEGQYMPTYLQGPGSVWCDVDVVEFSYSEGPVKELMCTDQVERLRGFASKIGSGSQVSSHQTCGTLGAVVRSRIGGKQVGFVTNRHVAIDLDYPYQKIFHPWPPNVGPGVYVGAVERATSFVTDKLWFGIFAGSCPDTSVRVDAAFVPFASTLDTSVITTAVGDLDIGELQAVDIKSEMHEVIGKSVTKLGRSSGPTYGRIMAYGLQYSDEKGITFLTDFLIVGDDENPFDMEGDCGSMILVRPDQEGGKHRPLGMIWGGNSNRGRLRFSGGKVPVNWSSAVDLGRLLNVLHLDILSSNAQLQEALMDQCSSEGSSNEDDNGGESPRYGSNSSGGQSSTYGSSSGKSSNGESSNGESSGKQEE